MFKLKIKNGHNVNIAGNPDKKFLPTRHHSSVSLSPENFRYIKPKLLVKENDFIQLGNPVFFDKLNPEIKWPAIASGKVSKIVYGDRRVIKEIIFEVNDDKEKSLQPNSPNGLSSKEGVINYLLEKNMWPFLKQRPFNKVANPSDNPKSIIISLANTAPLAINHHFTLSDQQEYIVSALKHLKELTDGKLFLIVRPGEFTYLSDLEYIDLVEIEGPHPAGNIGVVLNHIQPINNKDIIWTVEGHHLPILGKIFSDGIFDPSITINIAGPCVKKPSYIKTRLGCPVDIYCQDNLTTDDVRIISGNVLTGKEINLDGYTNFYDSSISVIEKSFERSFMGWLHPGGSSKYSIFNAYVGDNKKPYRFTTLQNGSKRAFVPIGAWEKVFPMDIYINELARSIAANDVDEMEQLGIYECDEEDVALCSFVCPSKTNVGAIIRKGLDLIYFDG